MRNYKIIFAGLVLTFLFGNSSLYAFEYNFHCHSTPALYADFNQSQQFLEKGGTAFMFDLTQIEGKLYVKDKKNQVPFNPVLNLISAFSYQHKNSLFTLLIRGKYNGNTLKLLLEESKITRRIYFHEGSYWPKPSQMCRSGKNVLVFTEKESVKPLMSLNDCCTLTSYFRLEASTEYEDWFVNPASNLLLIYYPFNTPDFSLQNVGPISGKWNKSKIDSIVRAKKTVTEMSFDLWKKTGKIPNYLICDMHGLDACLKAADSVNSTSKSQFSTTYSGKFLNKVHWAERESLITSGYFTILTKNGFDTISPVKNGYTFSPDKIMIGYINFYELNTFQAFLENNPPILGMDFIHNQYLVPKEELNFANTIKTDSGMLFNGVNSIIDCGGKIKINETKPLSISTKICPFVLDSFRILLSKNFSFSLKTHNQYATFTLAGKKDYVAKNVALQKNKWLHIVVVYIPKKTVSFYLDGKLIDVQKISVYRKTENSLMIGNNEMGSDFYGVMKDLYMWNRALSDDEIQALYNGTHEVYERSMPLYRWLLIFFTVLILALLSLLIWKRQKRGTVALTSAIEPALPDTETEELTEIIQPKSVSIEQYPQINFFGKVQIIDAFGEDKTALFPSKILQLFVLIACNSLPDKKGISSKEICNVIWGDYDPESAENNRKYSINKLKKVLEGFENINLVYDDKNWKITIGSDTQSDFIAYEQFVHKSLKCDKDDISRILPVLKKGPFLNSIKANNLDMLKNSISHKIVDLLLQLSKKPEIKADSKLCVEIAETIFCHDDVEEEAISLLIHSLLAEGKNRLAHVAYEQFCKRYNALFGIEYKVSFQKISRYEE